MCRPNHTNSPAGLYRGSTEKFALQSELGLIETVYSIMHTIQICMAIFVISVEITDSFK